MVEYASERRDSMIEKFSKQITSHLILKDVIQSETAEVYRYGIELVISTFIVIILVLLAQVQQISRMPTLTLQFKVDLRVLTLILVD